MKKYCIEELLYIPLSSSFVLRHCYALLSMRVFSCIDSMFRIIFPYIFYYAVKHFVKSLLKFVLFVLFLLEQMQFEILNINLSSYIKFRSFYLFLRKFRILNSTVI